MPVLEVACLRKSFGDRIVLDGLSFSVAAGEVFGLVGPNGAGKTTCVNVLCGLLPADAGRVSLDGKPLSSSPARTVGVVPQELSLYASLSALQNLCFFARLYGASRAEAREQAERLVTAVGLSRRAHAPVATLSGGMRRRLNIAVGLVHDPRLLLLDEPTVGLDLESRDRLWELILSLRDAGRALLLTTHYLAEAEALCTRIGIVRNGAVVAEGAMADLRRLVPAAEIAWLESPEPDGVVARAGEQGLTSRRAGDLVGVWLPRRESLEAIATRFRGLPVRSVALRGVGLEDVFREVTRGRDPSPTPCADPPDRERERPFG